MKREYDIAIDFTKGMDTRIGIEGDQDAPLFLQDALIDRQPEVWRRGGVPFTKFTGGTTWSAPGEVLASMLYGYGGRVGTIVVVAEHDKDYTSVWYLDKARKPAVIFRFGGGDAAFGIYNPKPASIAHLSVAWTTKKKSEENIPNRVLLSSDTGCFSFRFWWDEGEGKYGREVDLIVMRGNSGTPLKGDGYYLAAECNGYNFLLNRQGNSGVATHRDYLAFSGQYNSTAWSENAVGSKDDDLSDLQKTGGIVSIPTNDTVNITGVVTLGDKLLIFKRNVILALTVSADPNAWSVKTVAEVGTLDHRSIQKWKDGVVFANQKGIWYFNGYDVMSISDGIEDHYMNAIYSGSEGEESYGNDWRLIGLTYDDYYFLFISDGVKNGGGGNPVIAYLCFLPTKSWTTLGNMPMQGACISGRGQGSAYGFRSRATGVSDPGRCVRLDYALSKPVGYNQVEGLTNGEFPGTGTKPFDPIKAKRWRPLDETTGDVVFPRLKIKTRFRNMGAPNTRKVVRELLISYTMKNKNDTDLHKLFAQIQKVDQGQELDGGNSPIIHWFGKQKFMNLARKPVVIRSTGFSVELYEGYLGEADYIGISSIQLGYKPMRPSRNPSPLG